MRSIQVTELATLLKADDRDFRLLDVREGWEYQLAAIDGADLIPMGEIPRRVAELVPEQTTFVICHHGNRSRTVCQFLDQQGFRDVVNVEGGIEAWAEEVDPDVPRY
ncbi:MAG TPA: rhodanese-like domain-containing protein [Gammaproteobacteria bacterium]|jgi:rhodanese-related sulfurtransferase|nr:rhodanese-like domain-containing protein [Gammaproteobacteria bacterium]